MTDPSRIQTVDNEIAKHCAYSLPAVALTLGRSNWPLLKDTYEILARDMQWKVRRSLASSIHELGVILGEGAHQDLIPIFNGFLKVGALFSELTTSVNLERTIYVLLLVRRIALRIVAKATRCG